MFSAPMYSHTSSSVQFESGNTRIDSPGPSCVLNRFHSSGRWLRGSQTCAAESVREDALLRPALLLVAPRAADRGIELPLCRAPGAAPRSSSHGYRSAWSDAIGEMPRAQALLVDMDQQVEAELRRGAVAERDHLPEFPGRVDVQERERNPRRKERLAARGAAARSNPCRWNRAAPDCGIRPRPRAG